MALTGAWKKIVYDVRELLAPFGWASAPHSGEPPSPEDIEFLKELAGEDGMALVDPKRLEALRVFEGSDRLAQWKEGNIQPDTDDGPKQDPWG